MRLSKLRTAEVAAERLGGEAMRAEVTRLRGENDALRACLVALVRRLGVVTVTKRELAEAMLGGGVDVEVQTNGDTRVSYAKEGT